MRLIILIGLFEGTANLSIEALKGQIEILDALGYSPFRASFIARLKAQAKYLEELLEKNEEIFIETIEDFSNQVIDHTAEARDGFIQISKQTGDPELKEIAEIVTTTHTNTVKHLAEEETEAIQKVRKSISPLKDAVAKLKLQIDNLRIH